MEIENQFVLYVGRKKDVGDVKKNRTSFRLPSWQFSCFVIFLSTKSTMEEMNGFSLLRRHVFLFFFLYYISLFLDHLATFHI